MTKVLMNLDLLDYRQYMKETLRQVIQHNHIDGIRQSDQWEIPLAQKNLQSGTQAFNRVNGQAILCFWQED